MNDYRRKMAQVLKTQAAISAMCAEVFTLMGMAATEFGNDTINNNVLEDLFVRGIEANTIISDAVEVAHKG